MAIRFDKGKFADLARQKGLTVAEVLRRAGVSRNAYYNVLRKASLLPKSLEQLAEVLDAHTDEFLTIDHGAEARMARKMLFVQKLAEENPEVDTGTALTTLKLLDLTPRERLEQSIRYGKTAARF